MTEFAQLAPSGRLARVMERLDSAARAAGRDPVDIGLVAVSKYHPAEAIAALAEAGQTRFGESYADEGIAKMAALADHALEWHFVGPIQSNKTRRIAEHFHWVHGIEREKIARRLSDQRPEALGPLPVCLQVNLSGEASKAGCDPEELPALARTVATLPRLRLRGLMTLPAPTSDPAEQRRPFARLRALLASLRTDLVEAGLVDAEQLDTLSMGMSGDLEAAVAEGATLVRVGTDLFGPRPANGAG